MRHSALRRPAVLGITLGDPGGIGPEVTLKALTALRREKAFYGRCVFVLLGPFSLFETWAKRVKFPLSLRSIPIWKKLSLAAGKVYVLDPGFFERRPGDFLRLNPGKISARLSAPCVPREGKAPEVIFKRGGISRANARLAALSLHTGACLADRGELDALVTAPVNKEAMRLEIKNFCGHTEYLARLSGARRFAMMFDGGALRVTLVTIHMPLREVNRRITRGGILSKIILTDSFLRGRYGLTRPRIAVTALNPHGREFGTEEAGTISPAIRDAARRGVRVSGPHPGDEVFYDASRGKYDAVVAMYHDQGLGPLKTLAFDRAVNITLGLPYVRTSPDHGTAFDIAFQGLARPASMTQAIRLAASLTRS